MALTSANSEKTMASGSGDGRSSRSESFIRGYHIYYQRIMGSDRCQNYTSALRRIDVPFRYRLRLASDMDSSSFGYRRRSGIDILIRIQIINCSDTDINSFGYRH